MPPEWPLRETAEFAGKRALVTGGTRGIGAAVVDRLASGGASVLTTAVVRDARLVLRCLRHAGQTLILLHEERTTITAGDLAALGLARREAEILAWVALGKTDAEVAAILAISQRTVSHTLERV